MQEPAAYQKFNPIKVRQFFIICLLILIGYMLFKELLFMLSAFLGALTFYILMRKPHKKLTRKYKLKKWLATSFLIVLSIILILVPIYFILQFVFNKVSIYVANPEELISNIKTINIYLQTKFKFTLLSESNFTSAKNILTNALTSTLGSSMLILTNAILMYFLLYFMLNNRFEFEKWIKSSSPFKRSSTLLVLREIHDNVKNNFIGMIILGFIQGLIAILGYYIFGVSEPILWGLITGAASVIPFVGTMIVWIPMAILLFAENKIGSGIGLSIWGFILIGGIDNVLRFILQKKLGETHPIITVLGVIIGVNIMGFWGLIYGPILISLFILLNKVYKREYVLKAQTKDY